MKSVSQCEVYNQKIFVQRKQCGGTGSWKTAESCVEEEKEEGAKGDIFLSFIIKVLRNPE